MRLRISIAPRDDGGWTVTLSGPDGVALAPSRDLAACGGYPQPQTPPDGPDDDPAIALCRTGSEIALKKAVRAAIGAAPTSEQVVTVGRYLHHTLLGDTGWAAIVDAAGAAPESIDLVLSWDPVAVPFDHLPWELLHDGDGFILDASERVVSLTRKVKGPDGDAPSSLT